MTAKTAAKVPEDRKQCDKTFYVSAGRSANTIGLTGFRAEPVACEQQAARGSPMFHIVGRVRRRVGVAGVLGRR